MFRAASVLVLIAGLVAGMAALADEPTTRPKGVSKEVKKAIGDASMVVAGRVAGTAVRIRDVKVMADKNGKFPLVVMVDKTIKGPDVSGQEIIIQRTKLALDDKDKPALKFDANLDAEEGKSYIFYLRADDSLQLAYSVIEEATKATDEALAAAGAEVKAQGGTVEPKRVVWMTHTGGWGAGKLREFTLTKDGDFRYFSKASKNADPKELVGKLSKDDVQGLIARLSEAGKGRDADDAGYVAFEFVDKTGKLIHKDYSMPGAAPCSELLAAVANLANKNGKAAPAVTQSSTQTATAAATTAPA